jgi:acyl carrier protein
MILINKKLYRILKSNFGINSSEISEDTNLIKDYNLCNWESELLFVKVENTFNININAPAPTDEISVKKLHNIVKETLYHNNLSKKTSSIK